MRRERGPVAPDPYRETDEPTPRARDYGEAHNGFADSPTMSAPGTAVAAPAPVRRCARCDIELSRTRREDAKYCGSGCRGVASRERSDQRDGVVEPWAARPAVARKAATNDDSDEAAGSGRMPATTTPNPRICQHAGCEADLGALGHRASARFCSPAHKTAAHRQRIAAELLDAETARERTRVVRRAAAARRRAEHVRQRDADRVELEALRAENKRLRRCVAGAAELLLGE